MSSFRELQKRSFIGNKLRGVRVVLDSPLNVRRPLILSVVVIFFVSVSAVAQEVGPVAPAAAEYLNRALDLMQKHSINSRNIDWARLRKEVLVRARGAQTTYDTYDAIRFAIKNLDDHHSFLQLSDDLVRKDKESHSRRSVAPMISPRSEKWPPSPFINRRKPEGDLVTVDSVRVARIVIPMLENGDDATMQGYANALQERIAALAKQNPQGWIIDLRGNLGGNMWPMLAGIAPLIDVHDVGGFMDADGKKTSWFISAHGPGLRNPDGSEQILCRVSEHEIHSLQAAMIAVLMDRGTASSGEAVAVALRGQPGTRFFGRATHGQTTANQGFQLSDGANLVLATGIEADRTGRVYLSGLIPDVELAEQSELPKSPESDPMIQAAAEWIKATAGRSQTNHGDN